MLSQITGGTFRISEVEKAVEIEGPSPIVIKDCHVLFEQVSHDPRVPSSAARHGMEPNTAPDGLPL